jgi:hypothetical protein
MGETHFLKLLHPSKKGTDKDNLHLEPLSLFKGVLLNLNEGALNCLNRISRQEMQKNSPSPTLMEEYSLLHHYLDFIRRLCQRQ